MSESTPRAENSRDFFERPRRVNAGKHSKRLIQETLDGTRRPQRKRRKQASKKKSTKDGVEEKNDIYEVEKILMFREEMPGPSNKKKHEMVKCRQYLVKRDGYDDTENTWIDEKHMYCSYSCSYCTWC